VSETPLMDAQAKIQIDQSHSNRPDTETVPALASCVAQAMIGASVPLTLAWVALLGWLCFDLVRVLL